LGGDKCFFLGVLRTVTLIVSLFSLGLRKKIKFLWLGLRIIAGFTAPSGGMPLVEAEED